MTRSVPVNISTTVADLDMIGLGRAGETVCVVHMSPSLCYRSIDGEQDYDGRVVRWLISAAHARRVAAIGAWARSGWCVWGEA